MNDLIPAEEYYVDANNYALVPASTMVSYCTWLYPDELQVSIEQNLIGPFQTELRAYQVAYALMQKEHNALSMRFTHLQELLRMALQLSFEFPDHSISKIGKE